MSGAERWLRRRVQGAPERLMQTMLAALAPGSDAPTAEALAAAAARLYGEVAGRGSGREAALPLLAADALLTHAFQAQAEEDPAGLVALAARWGGRGSLAGVAAVHA